VRRLLKVIPGTLLAVVLLTAADDCSGTGDEPLPQTKNAQDCKYWKGKVAHWEAKRRDAERRHDTATRGIASSNKKQAQSRANKYC
jgi:hypothetical protein